MMCFRMTSRPVGLHSGKDSGSLEAVADLLLGIWRPDEDRDELHGGGLAHLGRGMAQLPPQPFHQRTRSRPQ